MDNKYDYDANLNYLLNNKIEDIIKDNIILQDKILKSNDFNTTYSCIEESLNLLYEKSRILQDIIDYTKTFLENEISTNINDCKTLLKSIEEDKDLIKNKTFINYSVPFYFGMNNTIDRNNNTLPDIKLLNNRLINSFNILNEYKVDYFTINRNNKSLYNNEKEYLKNKQYRTMYIFKNIQSKTIHETLIFSFNKPIMINKINPILSNCNIESIKLLLDTDNYIELDPNKIDLFDTKIVKSIELTISCSNYSISQTAYTNITKNNFSAIINNIKNDDNLLIANKYYYYLFGIDDIKFEYVSQDENSGYVSQDIYIGELKSNEYLTLYSDASVENGSIEYYIINGTETIPILPENENRVIDEKIFYKYPTRFTIDTSKEVIIKKNGKVENISIYEAMNKKDNNLWTISYTPIIKNLNNLYNKHIRIKVIMRSYGGNNSFINNIKVRKYGGNNLWIV